MTAPDAAAYDAEGVRDFTVARKPHRFRIAPDLFTAPAIISAHTLRAAARLHGSLGDMDMSTDEGLGAALTAVGEVMKVLLPGPGGVRFAERLLTDGADETMPAIDLQKEALPVIYWLLEQYGLGRPIVPSSDLPAGSTASTTGDLSDITSSTDGASPTA
jgi:hypothetical protein